MVTTENRLVARMPKRDSLPSILMLLALPNSPRCGLPVSSADITTITATTKISAIAQISAWPWRFSPAT
ncbi:hypothetical protein D3C80_2177540 [compost metagenome]